MVIFSTGYPCNEIIFFNKKNEELIHVTTVMDLENAMLNVIKSCILFMQNILKKEVYIVEFLMVWK